MKSTIKMLDCMDFEKVVFGWQHFLRYFEPGERLRVEIESDPCNPKLECIFLKPDADGNMTEKTRGGIKRKDCEKFFSYSGFDVFNGYESGKKQRIIVEYDPQNENAFIEFQEIG